MRSSVTIYYFLSFINEKSSFDRLLIYYSDKRELHSSNSAASYKFDFVKLTSGSLKIHMVRIGRPVIIFQEMVRTDL